MAAEIITYGITVPATLASLVITVRTACIVRRSRKERSS